VSEVAESVIQDLLLDTGEFQLGEGEITKIDKTELAKYFTIFQ